MLFVKLLGEEEPFCVIKNGRVSEIFLMVLFLVLEIVCGAITFILARKFNKLKEGEKQPPARRKFRFCRFHIFFIFTSFTNPQHYFVVVNKSS